MAHDSEPSLHDILFDKDSGDFDRLGWDMFREGVLKGNEAVYDDLIDYMDWEYGIDFEQEFDWSDFDSPLVD